MVTTLSFDEIMREQGIKDYHQVHTRQNFHELLNRNKVAQKPTVNAKEIEDLKAKLKVKEKELADAKQQLGTSEITVQQLHSRNQELQEEMLGVKLVAMERSIKSAIASYTEYAPDDFKTVANSLKCVFENISTDDSIQITVHEGGPVYNPGSGGEDEE